jgi:hypothetical protein
VRGAVGQVRAEGPATEVLAFVTDKRATLIRGFAREQPATRQNELPACTSGRVRSRALLAVRARPVRAEASLECKLETSTSIDLAGDKPRQLH